MCPEGVERVKLKETCEIKTGKGITQKEADTGGQFPIISGGIEPMGMYRLSNRAKNTVTISRVGANAGFVNYITDDFYLNDKCFSVIPTTIDITFDTKYLFYFLKQKERDIRLLQSEGGVPTINTQKIGSIEIPLPPLPIQQEIVNILDKFTSLQQNLEDELKLRQKQYEYYREKLLTFEEGECEWKKISDISNAVYAGATPSTKNKEYWENGSIRWMSSGEVHQGQVFEVEGRITQMGYDKCSTKMVPINSIVIALAGQGKTRGTVAITRVELCTNQSICAVVPNEEFVISDYLYFYLKGQYMNLRQVSSGDGTRGGLNLKMINNYMLPVPSLHKQSEIVQTLDHFESLLSNIKTEIELRKKQYEYYREKLLTFQTL